MKARAFIDFHPRGFSILINVHQRQISLHIQEFAYNLVKMRTGFLEKRDEAQVKEIDKTVKNKWNWKWLDKVIDDVNVGDFIRKLSQCGMAFCTWCRSEINYASRGWAAIQSHHKSAKHQGHLRTRQTNFRLSGVSNYFIY